jgi:hypothetical protein
MAVDNSDAPTPLRHVQHAAALLLAVLLIGYIIFNKPFATLGRQPVYIGEIIIAIALLALLPTFRIAFIEPLRQSWAMRLIAAFFAYGTVRALIDYSTHGEWALRDSVIATYALVAFVAPTLWRLASPPVTTEPLATRIAAILLPVSLWSAVWAAAILFGYINLQSGFWASNKPDFSTLAAALAMWMCAVALLRNFALIRWPVVPSDLVRIGGTGLIFLALTFLAGTLMLRLPTRAVYISVLPLAAISVITFAKGRAQKIAVAVGAAVILLAGSVFFGSRYTPLLREIDQKYALHDNLDFSVNDLEIEGRNTAENFGTFTDGLDLSHISQKGFTERLASVVSPDENKFETLEGRRAAHAGEWRLAFWQRSFYYTLHHAPISGIGFGENVTNLMRHSGAWEMYKPAMSLGNRNPHSGHLTVFVRLGFFGVALWLAILALVFWSALRTCWRYRDLGWREKYTVNTMYYRRAFFGMLAIFGVWLIYLTAMSFGVVLENPFGGMVFWALSGVIASREPLTQPQN